MTTARRRHYGYSARGFTGKRKKKEKIGKEEKDDGMQKKKSWKKIKHQEKMMISICIDLANDHEAHRQDKQQSYKLKKEEEEGTKEGRTWKGVREWWDYLKTPLSSLAKLAKWRFQIAPFSLLGICVPFVPLMHSLPFLYMHGYCSCFLT